MFRIPDGPRDVGGSKHAGDFHQVVEIRFGNVRFVWALPQSYSEVGRVV